MQTDWCHTNHRGLERSLNHRFCFFLCLFFWSSQHFLAPCVTNIEWPQNTFGGSNFYIMRTASIWFLDKMKAIASGIARQWEKVCRHVNKAVVFIDSTSAELLHWQGGLSRLLLSGAEDVKEFSSFEVSHQNIFY